VSTYDNDLVAMWRQRVDYPTLKANVQTLAKKWNARRVLVEDAGAGASLVQELRGRVTGIIAVKPDGDKASRMAVASAKFEAGQVLLPERASWLPDLEAELFVFQVSLSEKLDSKRIYDAQFFVQHANYNGDVVAAFQTYLRPSILTSTGHAYHIDLHLCREGDLFCGGGSP
jgi:predicted phage terminase large subunit-like protein